MINLTGMPDFKSPLIAGELVLYPPFGSGSYSLLPRQTLVAQDAAGKPEFILEFVKSAGQTDSASQYSVMDISLDGDYPLDEALPAARSVSPDATVKPVAINRGFARLFATTTTVPLPSDLTNPVILGWGGPGLGRWTTRLTADSGVFLKGALASQVLPFSARVEFDVLGVVAPVAVSIEFDPAALLSALLAGNTSRLLAYSDVLKFFSQPPGILPLKIYGTLSDADAGLFPQALADRISAAYSILVPAPSPTDDAFGSFTDPATLPAGPLQWDLSQPCVVQRQSVFMLDAVQGNLANLSGAVVQEITIPALDLGYCQINLTANLPASRVGVPAIGVTVDVPANLPFRAAAIHQTISFTPPNDQGSVSFRISPDEALSYVISGFAVVAAGAHVQEYTAPPRALSDSWVQLQGADFPVQFSHLKVADRLLQLAQIVGKSTYSINGQEFEQDFTLNGKNSEVAVATPAGANNASLALTAVPADGSASIELPPLLPGNAILDLPSFREYGPHLISISCRFNSGSTTGPIFIELIPDAVANDAAAQINSMAKRVFTPNQSSDTWGYVTNSPFCAGYRYRLAAANGAPPPTWSSVQSPFAPLILNPDGSLFSNTSAIPISQNQLTETSTVKG